MYDLIAWLGPSFSLAVNFYSSRFEAAFESLNIRQGNVSPYIQHVSNLLFLFFFPFFFSLPLWKMTARPEITRSRLERKKYRGRKGDTANFFFFFFFFTSNLKKFRNFETWDALNC